MMRPPDYELAIAVAEGRADAEERRRVAASPRLAHLAASFGRLLRALDDSALGSPEIPPRLLRWASAYAAVSAPRPRRSLVLDLFAAASPLAAAVRGGGSELAAELHGDERHQVDLRLRVGSGGDLASLHGHVLRTTGPAGATWRIAVITAAGAVHRTDSDRSGEFRVDGLPPTVGLTVVAEDATERLVVPSFGAVEEPPEP